jgi:hypothetical protein
MTVIGTQKSLNFYTNYATNNTEGPSKYASIINYY